MLIRTIKTNSFHPSVTDAIRTGVKKGSSMIWNKYGLF